MDHQMNEVQMLIAELHAKWAHARQLLIGLEDGATTSEELNNYLRLDDADLYDDIHDRVIAALDHPEAMS